MDENEFWTAIIFGLVIGIASVVLTNQFTILPELRIAGQSICDDTYGEGKTTFISVDTWYDKVNCEELPQNEEKPFDGIKVVKLGGKQK